MPALLLVGDYVVSNVESCILRVGRLFSEIVVVTAEALEKKPYEAIKSELLSMLTYRP